ncbi:MAG: YdiU family protein, partial [Myxococcales bacterium]|nr:YdiU family protein [Myxococcales bacterium]
IDYGPYGWLEGYDPDWTPNTTDAQSGRYRYGHQPGVGLWNVARLAEAFHPLIQDEPALNGVLDAYREAFAAGQDAGFTAKLGLGAWRGEDEALVGDLLDRLRDAETDMPIFYRLLSGLDVAGPAGARSDADWVAAITPAFYDADGVDSEQRAAWAAWLRRWAERVRGGAPNAERQAAMKRANPKYVLRNWMAQQAIDAAEQGDLAELHRLFELLQRPYAEQPEHEVAYFQRRPEWARHKPGCSMLSCSS